MNPEVLLRLSFVEDIKSVLLASSLSSPSIANIDYFVLSRVLGDIVSSPYRCELTTPKPHVPLCVSFRPRPKDLKVWVFKDLKKLPVAPPVGPLTMPHPWEAQGEAVESLLAGLPTLVPSGQSYTELEGDSLTLAQESLSQARRSNSYWRMSSHTKTCTSLT